MFCSICNFVCIFNILCMWLITWTSVWNFFHSDFEFIYYYFIHNNNDTCKLFSQIHVSQPHVTLWHSFIYQTRNLIMYLSTVFLAITYPYLSCTSYQLPLPSDWSMSWYISLKGICNTVYGKTLSCLVLF